MNDATPAPAKPALDPLRRVFLPVTVKTVDTNKGKVDLVIYPSGSRYAVTNMGQHISLKRKDRSGNGKSARRERIKAKRILSRDEVGSDEQPVALLEKREASHA